MPQSVTHIADDLGRSRDINLPWPHVGASGRLAPLQLGAHIYVTDDSSARLPGSSGVQIDQQYI